MKLYAEYIKEREDAEIEYNEHGFMTYKEDVDGIFLIDAYIIPEKREKGIINELLTNIIKKTGIKKYYTSVDTRANGWEISQLAILKSGFTVLKKNNYEIYYSMEIQ